MGVINVTPDSFYDGGVYLKKEKAVERAGILLQEGASLLDIGGFSSRPGAEIVPEAMELERLLPVIEALLEQYPEVVLSVDTMSSRVARAALEAGAHMINDISGGRQDPGIMRVCAEFHAPFILMHMQGLPETMQDRPTYEDVVEEVLRFFVTQLRALRIAGVHDVLLDPGFGFGKDLTHNYTLLDKLGVFKFLELPIVAGLSRKSMICKVLKVPPAKALNGTTALHMLALERGARILRAHDVREAVEAVKLFDYFRETNTSNARPDVL